MIRRTSSRVFGGASWQLLLVLLCHPSVLAINEVRFDQVVSRLENDVLELRDRVEDAYTVYRCDEAQLTACTGQNLDECQAALPNPTCLAGPNFAIAECGQQCSGYVDFAQSVIRLPPSGNININTINDLALVEDVCYSRHMDEYLIEKRQASASYWQEVGVEPQAQYFGSHNGMMRIYPGRASKVCNAYDPTIRPWYVAGSSGPKNIVMVLDKSGSMQGLRLALMKQAAQRVIDTLTPGDRIAIVAFDEETTVIAAEDKYLYAATKENKEILHAAIDGLEARRQTNFYDAFRKAFDVLDESIANEFNAPCNSAVLFLTDGLMTHPDNVQASDVIDLVGQRIASTSAEIGKPVILFTYSVSEEEDVHELPKQIACSTEFGTWSRIDDADSIVESLSSYYLLFALGLGSDRNADFTAWVEPYNFTTGNILGTTVSAPVYDRSKSPHLFLGVVAIDIALEALNRALETDDSSQAIERLSRRSVARCPALVLSDCELESYRAATGGPPSRCDVPTCSADDDVETIAKQCTDATKYPTILVSNTDHEGLSYADRACCSAESSTGQCAASNAEEPSHVTGDDGPSVGAIVGGIVGGLAVLIIIVVVVVYCMGGGEDGGDEDDEPEYKLPPPIAPSAPPGP